MKIAYHRVHYGLTPLRAAWTKSRGSRSRARQTATRTCRRPSFAVWPTTGDGPSSSRSARRRAARGCCIEQVFGKAWEKPRSGVRNLEITAREAAEIAKRYGVREVYGDRVT